MNKEEINKFISQVEATKDRNIVIIDYANMDKWQRDLKWKIGIKELKDLIKHFTFGKKFLRRFYYGSDYGHDQKSEILTAWSETILNKARMSGFEIITKRVKYIHNKDYKTGFVKKCDLDVEMSVDLIENMDYYDNIILFSGDGDIYYALKYLNEKYNKETFVFVARGHVGREFFDLKKQGAIKKILFIEDFEYRLNKNRFKFR